MAFPNFRTAPWIFKGWDFSTRSLTASAASFSERRVASSGIAAGIINLSSMDYSGSGDRWQGLYNSLGNIYLVYKQYKNCQLGSLYATYHPSQEPEKSMDFSQYTNSWHNKFTVICFRLSGPIHYLNMSNLGRLTFFVIQLSHTSWPLVATPLNEEIAVPYRNNELHKS